MTAISRAQMCVATMTAATHDDGAELVESLRVLSGVGLPVFVTDAGSPASFVAAIRQLDGVDVEVVDRGSLCVQIVASLTRAARRQTARVLYTEPDKLDFFRAHLPRFLTNADEYPDAGVVLAARSADAFSTFPETQKTAEHALNTLCGTMTGADTDYSYGPFVLHRDLIQHLDTIPADLGWGWRPFVFALAARRGLSISSVVGNYECPLSQRNESSDDRLHRMRQLAQNVTGLVLAAGEAL